MKKNKKIKNADILKSHLLDRMSSFDTEAFLASDHKHPRDANITFQDNGHVYTMNGSTDNISVTTLVGQYFSKFHPKLMSKLVARFDVEEL